MQDFDEYFNIYAKKNIAKHSKYVFCVVLFSWFEVHFDAEHIGFKISFSEAVVPQMSHIQIPDWSQNVVK